jgi:hypothetical protein
VANPERQDIWEVTTWDGSRKEQLRRALQLTLRERLQALDEMGDLARHFEWMRENGRFRSPGGGG